MDARQVTEGDSPCAAACDPDSDRAMNAPEIRKKNSTPR